MLPYVSPQHDPTCPAGRPRDVPVRLQPAQVPEGRLCAPLNQSPEFPDGGRVAGSVGKAADRGENVVIRQAWVSHNSILPYVR